MLNVIKSLSLTVSLVISANTIAADDFLNHDVRKLQSTDSVNLANEFKDKTLLIVNTASNCGFTPQFKALENVYQKYKDDGLVVLGFPSDAFFQEEDNEKDTAKICFINYGVTFPMFATTEIRGKNAHPVFKYLSEQTSSPKWNFYKYLVPADRQNIAVFSSRTKPESEELTAAIEKALKKT